MNTLNKDKVTQLVADKVGCTKKDAIQIVDAFLEVVEESLIAGDAVNLVNFGKFQTKTRKGRTGRNPKTGEEIHIEEQRVIGFAAGKGFKDKVKSTK